MTDIYMILLLIVLAAAIAGLGAWSGRVVEEGRENR